MATQVSLNSGAVASAGALALQTNGTTQAVSISTSQVATLAQNPVLTSGTENGVAYLNGSKVLTTGSALVFDATNTALSVGGAALGTAANRTVFTLNATTSNFLSFGIGGTRVAHFYSDANEFAIANASGAGGFITMQTNGAEALRLTATSLYTASTINVGIGTSSPVTRLEIKDTTNNTALTVTSSYEASLQLVNGGGAEVSVINAGGSNILSLRTNNTERARIDSSGNLGLGVTPSNTSSSYRAIQIKSLNATTILASDYSSQYATNAYWDGSAWQRGGNSYAPVRYVQFNGAHIWSTAAAAGTTITTWTDAMTLDASGNLLLGTTAAQLDGSSKMVVLNSSATVAEFTASSGTATQAVLRSWNTATSGDNLFQTFHTDAGATQRGSITYNRAGGLVAYNTTSDYRAKDISGYVTDSGSVIDSVPVYMGKMKDATQERPMFIAHETPAYAHVGEKDAVDADGNPVYQQMDASALIPVMWAEIQSLRKRLAAANL